MTIPDILSEARRALTERSNAANAFVLPAGAFADFRLDGPSGLAIEADCGGDFALLRRNGRLYARMLVPWYDAFAAAWNGVRFPMRNELRDPDEYLCSVIIESLQPITPVAEKDFDLIRRCMDLPHAARTKPPETFTPMLISCARGIRAANARALAQRLSRYAIRACAASTMNFFRSFSTSIQ